MPQAEYTIVIIAPNVELEAFNLVDIPGVIEDWLDEEGVVYQSVMITRHK